MAQEHVAIREFSTARGNTLTVLIDLVEGRAQVVKQGQPVQDAFSAQRFPGRPCSVVATIKQSDGPS